jgi:hypothetical protein
MMKIWSLRIYECANDGRSSGHSFPVFRHHQTVLRQVPGFVELAAL